MGYYHGNMTLLETLKNLWLNKSNYKIFMLSTQYRLRLQAICKDIAAGTEVTLEDMIWAEKLSKVNTSARGMLSKARRLARDVDGSCLKYLDIGDSNPKKFKKGFWELVWLESNSSVEFSFLLPEINIPFLPNNSTLWS